MYYKIFFHCYIVFISTKQYNNEISLNRPVLLSSIFRQTDIYMIPYDFPVFVEYCNISKYKLDAFSVSLDLMKIHREN